MGKEIKRERLKDILREQGLQLLKAEARLVFSVTRASSINIDQEEFADEELEVLEAMCSRFARLSDLLIQKIYRLIDMIELESEGASIIDRIERAEKRGLIPSADVFLHIRQLRNEMAHEYAEHNYQSLFKDVLTFAPTLQKAVSQVSAYITGLDDSR